MKNDLNKVQIIGNLGSNPETRELASGVMVANLSIATDETWKDKETGKEKTHTEWHQVEAFGGLAEVMAKYLEKGYLVYIEGSLRTSSWTDEETGGKRYSTKIRADELKILSGKSDN